MKTVRVFANLTQLSATVSFISWKLLHAVVMGKKPVLLPEHFYHVYNRGNNGEALFLEERNYRYFMRLYVEHVNPVAETLAYCLMGNHFHLLLRVRPQIVLDAVGKRADRGLANLFIAYAMATNKDRGRSGSLFEKPFHRKPLSHPRSVLAVARYIHRNPVHHGFITDLREWPWSSFHAYLDDQPSWLQRATVMEMVGDRAGLAALHKLPDETGIATAF